MITLPSPSAASQLSSRVEMNASGILFDHPYVFQFEEDFDQTVFKNFVDENWKTICFYSAGEEIMEKDRG